MGTKSKTNTNLNSKPMRNVEMKVYTFEELSDEAKRKAIYKYQECSDEWWDHLYSDAEEIGIDIDGFDVYRQTIKGSLLMNVPDIVDLILKNHGEGTATYTLAEEFRTLLDELDEEEATYDDDYAQIEQEFLDEVLAVYLGYLRNEWEYVNSEEYFADLCEANGWEFFADGKLYVQ